MKKYDICIDFDGTVTTHEFPKIGKPIGSIRVLKDLQEAGHRLILFTMRSDRGEGENYLTEAVDYLKEKGIDLYGVQENPTQKNWTGSPKAYGQIYIDDAALGCPLIHPPNGKRPYVDWNKVKKLLAKRGLLE